MISIMLDSRNQKNKYLNHTIIHGELVELIILKYNNHEIYLNYDNYIKLNKQIPDLTDADLGKIFIKYLIN